MNDKNIIPGTLTEGTTSLSTPYIEQIQAQMKDMQQEFDLLKKTINVLKKDPGIDQTASKNREKDKYDNICKKLLHFSMKTKGVMDTGEYMEH